MRLFQNSALYPTYRIRLDRLISRAGARSFNERKRVFLSDRFGAPHFLLPVLNDDPSAFFANGDDESTQRQWVRENGVKATATLEEILLAQIEAHRTEVFYNIDPMRYPSDFVRKLPGCVRRSIAWRAAPSPGADFSAYDLVVCNFPSILKSYEERGWRAGYLAPAHDPVMDRYAANDERPVDVLFVGGYSRHHRRRAEILEAVAARCGHLTIKFHLDRSRMTRWAESPLGRYLPLAQHRRPREIRAVTAEPVFGLDLYATLSQAKIVLNGAVDMAGEDRGNMRCFEAMGCRGLLLSDMGNYPPGMIAGINFASYSTVDVAVRTIERALAACADRTAMSQQGYEMIRTRYSKEAQWRRFLDLAQ